MNTILTVKNLTVQFDGEPVIEDVNFELNEGENLTVIGPNGSGKTVLLKALMNTIPSRGEITWAPNVRLGYVPQKIEVDKHLPLNAKSLFAAKAKILKTSIKDITTVAKTMGLSPDILETPIGHLSGGQFQKCLITFALIGKPNVLLFDEPTSSIDRPREEQIYETLHRLQDELGLTLILVSHDLSLVYRYATKVLCLNKYGLCFGVPSEVLTTKVLEELYGAPHRYYHHLHEHNGHEH
ncbi:MAG: metal ABC transporter ATP-binding protein [Patescibacteria group bacterium]